MRLFIAVYPSPSIITSLASLQEELREGLGPEDVRALRFVAPANIHLTLKFLGEVEKINRPILKQELERACTGIAPFDLRLTTLGCFPNARRPRVVWAGLDGELESLQKLQGRVDSVVGPLCPEADNKAFTPHVTLARVQSLAAGVAQVLQQVIAESSVPDTPAWRVGEIALVRSELSPRGARYEQLATFPLS